MALGIGIYQAINTASTETMKKDKISELGEFSRKPCTIAKIINAKVIRGKRLTIDDATKIFLKREDIMCDTRIDAQFVALKTNRKYYEHRKHKPLPNYYQHFHVQGYKHIHIWYIE